VRGGSARAQEEAAAALGNLALDNADNSETIARAGAIEPLVALVRSGSAGALEEAAASLATSP
jgi:vacuolar protein 8